MSRKGWLIIPIIFTLILAQASFAVTGKYGMLKVITEDENAEIYIDGGFAGNYMVTDDKIVAGTHYLQVRIDGEKIYDKGFIVHEGKQITIFARSEGEIKRTSEKASGLDDKLKYPFFYSLTYGGYTEDTRYNTGASASGTYQSALGLGVGVKYLKEDNKNIYYTSGFHYNAETGNVQISYVHIDVGSENEAGFSELGINFSLWKVTGVSVSGSLGYQVALGFHLTDNLKWGVKYAAYNGSGSIQGYSFNTTFTQLMLFVRAQ